VFDHLFAAGKETKSVISWVCNLIRKFWAYATLVPQSHCFSFYIGCAALPWFECWSELTIHIYLKINKKVEN